MLGVNLFIKRNLEEYMSTHIDRENGNKNVSSNGSGMSLRELVDRNEKAMHGMSSRFGDVNVLKTMLEQLLGILANQKEMLGQEVKVLSESDAAIKASLETELGKIRKSVLIDQKNTIGVGDLVNKEIEQLQKLEEKFNERLVAVELAINKRLKRQRYLWYAVGVLVLSLVCCLGYLCNELRYMSKQVQDLKVNIDSSMTEVKGAILSSTMDKVIKEKAVSKLKKK